MKAKIAKEGLETYCNSFAKKWLVNFRREDYEKCLELSTDLISQLKPILKNRDYGEETDSALYYNFIYNFLMLARGLNDIHSLVGLTADKHWPEDNAKTEVIWQLLWDAKERFDVFNVYYSDTELLTGLYRLLKKLELCFYDLFGKGLYMSSVILVKKSNCSICGKNIKACEHLPGTLYSGKPCKEVAVDFQLHGADFVQSPHDMRCRVWPWNFTDDMQVNARILNLNKLDDFIDE